MWNPVTRDQSTSVCSISAARKTSWELPVASMTLASPRSSTALRIASAASVAAAAANDCTSSKTRMESASTVNARLMRLRSCELRGPTRGGGEHLVGHLGDVVEVDPARQRIEQHRLDRSIATARERRLHRHLLRRDDAAQG